MSISQIALLVVAALGQFPPDRAPGAPIPTVRFVRNAGQWPSDVLFGIATKDERAKVTTDGLVVDAVTSVDLDQGVETHASTTIHFRGADWSNTRGEQQMPGTVNFIRGAEDGVQSTSTESSEAVYVDGAWPGISIRFYVDETGALRFDFIGAQGSDPSQIVLDLETGGVALRPTELGVAFDLGSGYFEIGGLRSYAADTNRAWPPMAVRSASTSPFRTQTRPT